MVADVDTLDHLYLRVISPLVGALVVIVVVTCGLSLLDVPLALTLGGIMLATCWLCRRCSIAQVSQPAKL